jgi:hypothetical protein
VDCIAARELARRVHAGQVDRSGGLLIDHIARVAEAVPREARSVAWLHELLEQADGTDDALRSAGLDDSEVGAVHLLTRRDDEPYDQHALGLAFAQGDAAHLARLVKLADLEDHLSHVATGIDAPPYAWARRHIARAEGDPASAVAT